MTPNDLRNLPPDPPEPPASPAHIRAEAEAARSRYANHGLISEYDAHMLAGYCLDLLAENERLRAIIARIDKVAPRADHEQDEPGIKLSTAVRRALRAEGHPLFRK